VVTLSFREEPNTAITSSQGVHFARLAIYTCTIAYDVMNGATLYAVINMHADSMTDGYLDIDVYQDQDSCLFTVCMHACLLQRTT